ncbi:MAG: hypothetical protein WCR72_10605 [Bacteroidota bacterium]
MKKIINFLKKQLPSRNRSTSTPKKLSGEISVIKIETRICLTMPRVFDFTAYYDDKELENNAYDIPHENPTMETNAKEFNLKDEKSNGIRFSSNSQQFECCIN